ncbi:MAG: VUT family protein [Bacteroidales bacterium]|nr:VUT family protein [Bacteroidales bacterium]MBE6246834.1 VUT family protein [Bacteroidales bacterium]
MDKVSGNPLKNRVKARLRAGGQSVSNQTALMVVTALFVSSYLISNTMAVKVIGLFNIFYFDAGTITFPFAYMLGDVLTEIWGFRISKRVIWTTFFCNILMVVCTQIGVCLPSPEHLGETAAAYDHIFNYVPRIVLASLVGFLCGELSNAWLMVKIREKTKGKHLWVRTIGSSAVGYVFDSLPFVLIAFAGTVSVRELLLMIAFQYCSKLLIETVFGTPLAYAAIRFIRKYVRLDYNN